MIANVADAMVVIRELSDERDAFEKKYHELLFAVGEKYPGESRHETALRFITERGSTVSGVAKNVDTAEMTQN